MWRKDLGSVVNSAIRASGAAISSIERGSIQPKANRCAHTFSATTNGVTTADNRRFVDAVVHRYPTGIPRRDLPDNFGDWNNTHRRHSRWAKRGVWAAVFRSSGH